MSRLWNVRCGGRHLGTVIEESEEMARCAALSKFGYADDEFDEPISRHHELLRRFFISPDADFDVTPA